MSIYFDDIISFYILISPEVRMAELRSTRVSFKQVDIRPLASKMPLDTMLTSGYVEVNPLVDTLTIHLVTEKGAFVGNGTFSINTTADTRRTP